MDQWICGKCGENAHAHSLSTSECIWEPVDPEDTAGRLREFLTELGLSEGDGYEVRGEGDHIQFLISVPDSTRELPDELKPFALKEHELQRGLEKGHGEKRTMNGLRFELALSNYAHRIFHQFPEVKELEASLDGIRNAEGFKAYDRRRNELWETMWATNPRLQELGSELAKLY